MLRVPRWPRVLPLRVILNGLGKDAAQIIARINGFTYVQTKFDYFTGELEVVQTIPYSDGPRAAVNCYGADDVREGVAIMWHENADISITGNSTNPTRFQHPVAGTYSPTSRSARWLARSTSPSLPVAALAVPCIRTTCMPAPPPTA